MSAYHTNEIILADSQYLTRLALRKLLEPLSLVSSLTEAQNEQELCLMLHRSESPVVFLDYQKPGAFSLETIPLIQREAPRARIVLLTSDNSQEGIRQALEFGVDGFLTKHCDECEILEALKAVGNGERFYLQPDH
ncbi:MAG: response regulator transcription factor [Haliscomenobacter sp.]|nr:response regulator transcription factor [Haliscomenobacter sp.]